MLTLQVVPEGFKRGMKGWYEYNLCKRLREKEIHSIILTLGGEPIDGFDVKSYTSGSSLWDRFNYAFCPRFTRDFLRYARNCDIVNAHMTIWNPLSHQAARLNRFFTKKPFVLTTHNFEPNRIVPAWFVFKRPWEVRQWIDVVYNRTYFNADHVICLSNREKKHLVAILGLEREKVSVVPNGVDLSRFKRRYPFKDKFGIKAQYMVLFVGQLIELKGVKYFVDMAAKIAERRNDVVFVMITQYPKLIMELISKARSLRIIDRLFVFDFRKGLTDDDLVGAYFDCDALVLPSLLETMPTVPLEAMAASKPVVATNVGGVPEIVKDGVTGYLVDPGHSDLLAEKVLLLLQDEVLRCKMGKEGRARVSSMFDWTIVAQQIATIYRRLINN